MYPSKRERESYYSILGNQDIKQAWLLFFKKGQFGAEWVAAKPQMKLIFTQIFFGGGGFVLGTDLVCPAVIQSQIICNGHLPIKHLLLPP